MKSFLIYITVCKNTIISNLKRGENKPPLRISNGKYGKQDYAHQIPLTAVCQQCGHEGVMGRVVYDKNKPLPWGARAWIEINSPPRP